MLTTYFPSRKEKKLFSELIDPETENRNRTSRIVSQINRTLINSLLADSPHLSEADTDIDPRHEAYVVFFLLIFNIFYRRVSYVTN